MAKKRKIYRVLAVAAWCVAGLGLCILLGAAMKDRSLNSCRGYDIDINGSDQANWFIDKKDLVNIITNNGTTAIRGRQLRRFDLRALEQKMEKDVWIADAQLFFDNQGILQVRVTERSPVARVFSVNGRSFYLDTALKVLPISDKMVARLPVFTGFPPVGERVLRKDKPLARSIVELSGYISSNPFWMAQVAQMDIRNGDQFDMVPVVGNQVIEFGDVDDYEGKFNRLKNFYQQVLAKAGLEKYSTIRLQFKDQVVAVKKGGYVTKADSLKVISNIQQLIVNARKMQERQLANDSLALVARSAPADSLKNSESDTPAIIPTEERPSDPKIQVPERKTSSNEKRNVPKAVMKKR